MSVARPIDESSPSPRRVGPSRRRVLSGAVAGAAGVAAIRLLAGGDRLGQLQRLLPGAGPLTAGRSDWVSPLGSEQARVAHLLRRTTFGSTPAELEAAAGEGFGRTVDRLLETRPVPPPSFTQPGDVTNGSRVNVAQLQQWWVDWMLKSPTPFAERMTLFWHGHFTSDFRKVGAQTPFMQWQNLSWREMALTDLRSMLMRVTTDPAMLRYLDLASSTGTAPNENYARELLELFTMGVGNYREDDVRAAAKALAGWVEPKPERTVEVTVDPKNKVSQKYPVYGAPAAAMFVPGRAYRGGPLTFLGRTGAFDAQRVIDQILAQPATAVFIARQIAEHFVSARVDEGYVRRLADRFRASRHDLRTLLKAVFTSPEFAAGQSYRALVKSPAELMVHALKAVGGQDLGKLAVANGQNMGQALFDPPDVGGWPNNDAWISSNTVMARVNFASQLLGMRRALPPAAQALAQLDSVLSPQTAGLLNRTSDDHTRWLIALASPEFQLK